MRERFTRYSTLLSVMVGRGVVKLPVQGLRLGGGSERGGGEGKGGGQGPVAVS